jgi:predicted flap endonuclease-1-like 5' DNA nuclease
MSESAILIIAALLLAVLIIWILRSRSSQAGHHVDTSVTAVGAASEAARNVAEQVGETIEESMSADVAASGAKPGDVQAAMSNAAAIMASGGAAAGATTLTDIGVPAASGAPDDLRKIKGLGPKLNSTLIALGVTRFDQIASWNAEDVAGVDANLGTFKGRIVRDNWIEQATFLANGDIAGFEAKFGKLDG